MITESEIGILNTAYESGRKARFAVEGDQAWISREEATDGVLHDIPDISLKTITKFLSMNVIAEDETSADNSITYYRLTSRAYQVIDNPEIINQLTTALFF